MAAAKEPKETIKPLHLKLSADLVARIDDYRFEHRFDTRIDAIVALLEKSLPKVKTR
jgi:hypothetical protein